MTPTLRRAHSRRRALRMKAPRAASATLAPTKKSMRSSTRMPRRRTTPPSTCQLLSRSLARPLAPLTSMPALRTGTLLSRISSITPTPQSPRSRAPTPPRSVLMSTPDLLSAASTTTCRSSWSASSRSAASPRPSLSLFPIMSMSRSSENTPDG
jgi:hypothetical protein